jgi:regulator of replication initiation timing
MIPLQTRMAVLEAKLERRDKEIMLLKTALEASKSDLEASEENASILQFDNDRLQVENDRLREDIAALKASEDTRNNRAAARPTLVHLSTTAVPHHVSSASDATETGAAGAAAVKVSTLVWLAVRPCCSSRSKLPMRSHRGSEFCIRLLFWLFWSQAFGYDPRESKTYSIEYLQKEAWKYNDVNRDLKQVPGIDAAAVDKLGADDVEENERITNTHQLIGKYLMLKGGEVTFSELNHKFGHFLDGKGITSSHRNAIVCAISDKVSSFFPGFHDGSEEFDYLEDDE